MSKQKENILLLGEIVSVIGGDTLLYVADCTGDSDKRIVLVDVEPFKDSLQRLRPYYDFEVFHLGTIDEYESLAVMEILIQEQ